MAKMSTFVRVLLALTLLAGLFTISMAQPKGPLKVSDMGLCNSKAALNTDVWRFNKGWKALCCPLCSIPNKLTATATCCKNVYKMVGGKFARYNACGSPEV